MSDTAVTDATDTAVSAHDDAVRPMDATIAALRGGRAIVLVGVDRVQLVASAANVDLATICLLVRHGSGILTVVLPDEVCDALRLPASRMAERASRVPEQRVSFDAAAGITTGISATDRWRTVRLAAAPSTRPDDLVRPGHLIPVGVAPDAAGLGADAIELCRLALVTAAACVTDVVSPHGPGMLAPAEAAAFASDLGLPCLSSSTPGVSS